MKKFLSVIGMVCALLALTSAGVFAAKPAPATITVTVTTNKASYNEGETVVTTAVVKDSTGTPVTSIKTAKITIKDVTGATTVNAAALTNLGNGIFTYSYTIPAGSAAGTWTDSCTINYTPRISGTGSTTFMVAAPVRDHASLTWTGYGMCLTCHRTQAQAMYQSVHYQWKGPAAEMTSGPTSQGKMNSYVNETGIDTGSALNAYCINIQGNWNACGACHVGTGGVPVAASNPTDAQLASIDCLMCHNDQAAAPYSRVRNVTTGLFEPAAGVDMNRVVQKANIKPSRKNCLGCHAKAGGGDAVKRGDLALASGITSDVNYDVHMAAGASANLACQACHTFTDHRVAGRGSDLRPEDSAAEISCSSCHAGKDSLTISHTTYGTSHHVSRVACQTCHIAKYAKDAADVQPTPENPREFTETHRDWAVSEWNSALNRFEPTPTKAGSLTPTYAFWNGTSWGNNLGDAAVLDPATNTYKISRPVGGINDAASKIYPFKYKTASQPLDITQNILIAPSTKTYFATGNYTQAVIDGLANMGRSGDSWTTVTTDEYQVLNHQVPLATNVLTCAQCHPETSTTVMKLKTMGYTMRTTPYVQGATAVCSQCHQLKTPESFDRIHARHVETEGFDCIFCHNFSRPERGLSTTSD